MKIKKDEYFLISKIISTDYLMIAKKNFTMPTDFKFAHDLLYYLETEKLAIWLDKKKFKHYILS